MGNACVVAAGGLDTRQLLQELSGPDGHAPSGDWKEQRVSLFRHVEKFRFADGLAFDFRGETERNLHAKRGTLANSNQRAGQGICADVRPEAGFRRAGGPL